MRVAIRLDFRAFLAVRNGYDLGHFRGKLQVTWDDRWVTDALRPGFDEPIRFISTVVSGLAGRIMPVSILYELWQAYKQISSYRDLRNQNRWISYVASNCTPGNLSRRPLRYEHC